ncbi:MAG: hypothetical protein CVV44_21075 [Spirochaetae bacterium HGW-Spirochaetae-1]|jgi:hypothetical protein|nr:MAG: hypothetical protein CVV44_21075 [Spirochaetae bacterium HGW-Spirochaetae-1]
MKKTPYKRQLSFNERFFLVFDKINPPIANQFIMEGAGSFEPESWERAVREASEANPGSRVMLKGHLGFSRLVDSGKTPPVKQVDGSQWSGHDPENAPFLQTALPIRQGLPCEVLLVEGTPQRVIFRTHHSVMDGRGTMTWIFDIFRALNGKKCRGSNSVLTDAELAMKIQPKSRKAFPFEHIAPTGTADGEPSGVTWQRRTIQGTYPNITARLALLLAREAWKYRDGIVRISIPVDLRAYEEGLTSTGNLTFAIYVEIKKDSTVESIKNDITAQISSFPDGILSEGDDIYRQIPVSLMAWKAKSICRERHREGIYSISSLISNMGALDLSRFSGGGFTASAMWGIPPGGEYFPLVMGTCSYNNDTTEIIITMPKVLAGQNRMDSIFDTLITGLQQDESGKK